MNLFLKRCLNHNRIVKIIIFLIFVLIAFFFLKNIPVSENPQHRIDILVHLNDSELKTMIVSATEDRLIGLSDHEFLNNDEAMLFTFDTPGKYSFWMKDMNFDIDIFWLDENKEVIFIKENAQPNDYPETYGPIDISYYVLETVSGFSIEQNIILGSQFSWE